MVFSQKEKVIWMAGLQGGQGLAEKPRFNTDSFVQALRSPCDEVQSIF